MPKKITMDEWLAELQSLNKSSTSEGISVAQIADQMDWSKNRVLICLKKAVEAGYWEFKGRRMGMSIDGRACRTPIYGPVQEKSDVKRKR